MLDPPSVDGGQLLPPRSCGINRPTKQTQSPALHTPEDSGAAATTKNEPLTIVNLPARLQEARSGPPATIGMVCATLPKLNHNHESTC